MRILLITMALLFGGCTTYPNIYNPTGIDSNNLARVYFKDAPLFVLSDNRFYGAVTQVWNKSGEKVIEVVGLGYGTKSHQEVFLPEGSYEIQAYCFSNSLRANPHIRLDLQSGQNYELTCTVEGENGSIFSTARGKKISLSVIEQI